jgi:hypothetical protein
MHALKVKFMPIKVECMPEKEKCTSKNEKWILKKFGEWIVSDFFWQKQYYVVLQYLFLGLHFTFLACILLFWHAFYFFIIKICRHAKLFLGTATFCNLGMQISFLDCKILFWECKIFHPRKIWLLMRTSAEKTAFVSSRAKSID